MCKISTVQHAARVAVIGSILAVGLVALLPSALDEQQTKQDASSSRRGTKEASTTSNAPFTTRLKGALLLTWPLVLSKVCSGVINSAMSSARPLLLKQDFHFDAARLGVFMSASFFGCALVGVQLGRISHYLGGNGRTVVVSLRMMTGGYGLMCLCFAPWLGALGRRTANDGVWLYAALSLGLALFQFPLATTITALTTAAVPAALKGTQVGVEHASFAFASLLGPGVGVALLQTTGLAGCAAAAAAAYALLYAVWCAKGDVWAPAGPRGEQQTPQPLATATDKDDPAPPAARGRGGERSQAPVRRGKSPARR